MTDIIGTIISSSLNYDQLNNFLKENRVCHPATSSYAPCDGRSIQNSTLSRITGQIVTPDLRGKFIRGLNAFHLEGQPALDVNQADPDTRRFGDPQNDAIIKHTHPAVVQINGRINGTNDSHDVEEGDNKFNSDPPSFGGITVRIEENVGESETRPKNIAVFFYIKIN